MRDGFNFFSPRGARVRLIAEAVSSLAAADGEGGFGYRPGLVFEEAVFVDAGDGLIIPAFPVHRWRRTVSPVDRAESERVVRGPDLFEEKTRVWSVREDTSTVICSKACTEILLKTPMKTIHPKEGECGWGEHEREARAGGATCAPRGGVDGRDGDCRN